MVVGWSLNFAKHNLAENDAKVGAALEDDSSGNMVGVAGVLVPALGALQESGFAARRAQSRLLHMQTADYLGAHCARYNRAPVTFAAA